MGGRPPVAGLCAVAVAAMLAVGMPAGLAVAEQIRAPVLDGAPKAVKKKQVFRPTMPQRNPTRAPDAEALAAAIGEGAQEAAAFAAGSPDLAPEGSPPPEETSVAAETATVPSGGHGEAAATGSVESDAAETSAETSTEALKTAATGSETSTAAAPETEPPAVQSGEIKVASAPDSDPVKAAGTPPAEQSALMMDISPPEEPAPFVATPADAEPSTETAAPAEPPAGPAEQAAAATAVADAPAKELEHEVVLEIAPPVAAVTAPPAAEPDLPTGTVEIKESAPAAAEPEVQTAALTPPDEPAPVPSAPAEDEEPASVELDAAPSEAEAAPDGGQTQPSETSDVPASDTADEPASATELSTPSDAAAEPASGTDASTAAGTPAEADPVPVPAHPIVADIRSRLAEPGTRKGASAADVDALKAFYGEHQDPPLWVTDAGFTEKAHAIIEEIGKADDWGLDAGSFELPPANDLLATPNAHADDELQLSLAILSYARDAQIGRLAPSKASRLFDQAPSLRDPKTVLAEIGAADDPVAYLTALHPQHAQFKRLREALQKARAKAEASGTDPDTDRDVQLIVINMERWRWMPRQLGAYHVWNNVPEFSARVVKGGKTIYVERTIVGQQKYATPFFSAPMRTIVFHPDWTVPPTILKEDLAPRLQGDGGFFGNANTAILRQHDLRVSLNGQPVNPDNVDWRNAKIWQYTFTQPPGPANVLGQLKFNFPNRHAIYMHDTPQRELFAETVRTLSHGCIRVREPERLAALLLAEDRGWSSDQVTGLLAGGTTNVVKLNRLVPVHLTYFTAVIDEDGQLTRFDDIYGIDNRMAGALFDKPVRFPMPATPAVAQVEQPQRAAQRRQAGGGLDALISGLFGN